MRSNRLFSTENVADYNELHVTYYRASDDCQNAKSEPSQRWLAIQLLTDSSISRNKAARSSLTMNLLW
jgi:hypothetical protein